MAQGTDTGSFVPTTFVWDAAELQDIDVKSERFKELLVRLYQNLNLMQLNLNTKESAIYDTNEFVTGQTFPSSAAVPSASTQAINRRQGFRKMIIFGSLPNTGVKSVAHNIDWTSGFAIIRVTGGSTDTTGLISTPIPNSDINVKVTATDVVITTGADYSSYNDTRVFIEYLKQ